MTISRHILYIHGFNSSPQSLKARQFSAYLQQHLPETTLHLPALPYSPLQAMAQLRELLEKHPQMHLVGSSLGGFYATRLAEDYNRRAVVVNPAVRPWSLLERYQGEVENYHTGEKVLLQRGWAKELEPFHVEKLSHPENIMVMLQTADETLDWRDAWQHYQACHLYRALGGSHGFEHFEDCIPLIVRFCALI